LRQHPGNGVNPDLAHFLIANHVKLRTFAGVQATAASVVAFSISCGNFRYLSSVKPPNLHP
jgi:hypothetical protein